MIPPTNVRRCFTMNSIRSGRSPRIWAWSLKSSRRLAILNISRMTRAQSDAAGGKDEPMIEFETFLRKLENPAADPGRRTD